MIRKTPYKTLQVAFLVIVLILGISIKSYSQTLIPSTGSNSVACGTNVTLCTHAGCGATYSDNVDGYTVLNAAGAAAITISGSFVTESGYDYIYIFSGSGTGGTLLATYNGSGTINYTGSAGQTLTVQFYSDVSVVYTGLNATVTYSGSCTAYNGLIPYSGSNAGSICSGHVYDHAGGGDYLDNANGYSVLTPTTIGYKLQVSGTSSGEACCDYVQIYDGVGTGSLLGTYYMGTAIPLTTSTAANGELTVLFYSDYSITGAGIDLTVSCYNPCPTPGSTTVSKATACENENVDYNYSGGTGTFVCFQYQWDVTTGAWTDWGATNPYTWLSGWPGHTLYVRTKITNGTCFAYSPEISTYINTNSTSPTSISGTTTICSGSSTTLTEVGGALGTRGVYNWYTGSCESSYFENWFVQSYSTNQTTVNSVSGTLNVTSTGVDPMVIMENICSLDPTLYKYVNLKYRVISGTAGNVEIFYTNTRAPSAVGDQMVSAALISDGAWHVLSINMSGATYWTHSNIRGWRYDWCTASGVNMDLDYISISTGVLVDQGTSITVTPGTNLNYYVDAQGTCNTTACASTAITLNTAVSITSQPASITRCVGTAAVYSVTATGTGLAYQWKKNGVNIGGATTSTFTINPVAVGDAAEYTVVVSTACGSVTSSVAALFIDMLSVAPTSITATPNPVCNGSITTLTANGGLAVYYPFSSDLNDASGNGLNLSGAGGSFSGGGIQLTTGSSYTTASTALLNTDNYTISFDMKYTAVNDGSWRKIFGYEPSGSDRSPGIWKYPDAMKIHWRHDAGNTGLTEAFTYTLNQWYHITGVKAGNTFTLFVDGSQVEQGTVATPKFSGNAPLWFGGAQVILKEFKVYYGHRKWYTGGCGTTYVGVGDVFYATPSATTTYYVRSEGTCNTTACVNSAVTVNPVTVITVHPVSQTLCPGLPVTFSVTATGTGVLTYQWRKNTVNIGGATASSYNIPSIVAGDAANYDVIVTGTCGVVTSNAAILTVNTLSVAATSITAAPASVCSGASSTLSITGGTLGSGATWRWYSVGCGGTSEGSGSSLVVAPVSTTTYYLRAEGTCNSTACVNTTITINSAPAITVQPASQSICVGSPVTFTVTATGGGLTYQWRKNAVNIGGATANSYNIPSVAIGDAANYDVVVTGTCGIATSSVAVLTVNTLSVVASGATATPATICIGGSSTLSATGGTIGSGASWMWYTGSCGGTLAGTGTSLSVSPGITTTFWVRASGFCNTTACVSTAVTVSGTIPNVNAGIDQFICLTASAMAATAATGAGLWTLISGPNSPSITLNTSAVTTITGLISGTYVFRWTDTVGGGCTNYDDVVIFVQ